MNGLRKTIPQTEDNNKKRFEECRKPRYSESLIRKFNQRVYWKNVCVLKELVWVGGLRESKGNWTGETVNK